MHPPEGTEKEFFFFGYICRVGKKLKTHLRYILPALLILFLSIPSSGFCYPTYFIETENETLEVEDGSLKHHQGKSFRDGSGNGSDDNDPEGKTTIERCFFSVIPLYISVKIRKSKLFSSVPIYLLLQCLLFYH
jgi:hypothetical protein